jgi:hypothetical protein
LIEREVLTEAEIAELIGKRTTGNGEPAAARPHEDTVIASLDKPA